MKRIVPDAVILGLLKSEPAHGYSLLEYFNSNNYLGRIWTMSSSQLYAVLKRLDENGAISGHEVDPQTAPVRIVYRLTKRGENELNAWLFDKKPSTSIHHIRVMFLSRIYIANLLETNVSTIIENQFSSLKIQYDQLTNEFEDSTSTIERLTLSFVLGQVNSAIVWLQESDFNI